jgi:ribosomal protein S21
MKVNASIVVEPGESIESIVRRWKKACDKSNVIRTHARKSHFIPEPQRRADKSKRARKKVKEHGGA